MHLTSTEEKIYVAGHRGMVGRALWQRLGQAGYENLVGRRSRELDVNEESVKGLFPSRKVN